MSEFEPAAQDTRDLLPRSEDLNFLEEPRPAGSGVQRNTTDGSSPENVRFGKFECAICLQNCIHPVRLPCNHIFCFLCVKGVANQSKRCAMCRQEIPADTLDNPDLVPTSNTELDAVVFEDGYQWFYEGRNGWWQYDARTSIELETAFKRGEPKCEVLIAGFLYIVDFEQMVQVRRTDPSRRRRIKRDLANIPKKGVAGIRNPNYASESSLPSSSEESPIENVPADGASLSEDNDWSYIPIPGSSSEPDARSASWPIASKDTLTATQPPSPKSVPATPTNTPRSPEHSPTDGICGISAPSSPGRVSSQIVDNALAEVIHNLRLCDERTGEDDTTIRNRWCERRLPPLQTEELYESDEEQHV